MYAIELLNMINKFKEKYPDVDLSNRSIWVDTCGTNEKYIEGCISSYELGLEYIKISVDTNYINKICIPELKSILEKYKYKKINIVLENKIIKEISWLELRTDLCFSTGEPPNNIRKFVTRKEMSNV